MVVQIVRCGVRAGYRSMELRDKSHTRGQGYQDHQVETDTVCINGAGKPNSQMKNREISFLYIIADLYELKT